MSSEVELIVKAIEGLKTNIITDYILPVGTVLVSGLLGGGIAYYSINRQEQTKIEIDKINSINSIILSALDVRSKLIAIKQTYNGNIINDPVHRILNVPFILSTDINVDINLAKLAFLVPSAGDSNKSRFESIDHISSIFSNFHTTIDVWIKRNQLIKKLREQTGTLYGTPLNVKLLEQQLGKDNVFNLFDLTEVALMMTDEVLIEVCNFLNEFPGIAIDKTDKKMRNKFGKILKINLPPKNDEFITKVPEVNYQLLSMVLDTPVPILKNRYRPIYEDRN